MPSMSSDECFVHNLWGEEQDQAQPKSEIMHIVRMKAAHPEPSE